MNGQLPEAFVNRMRLQLQDELSAFLHSLDEPPVRGIRLNPMKCTQETAAYSTGGAVPWAKGAYYLDRNSEAGMTVMHEAGAFYIQEPAAMIPAAVLNAQPGERILDLCAAPGGKATQIGLDMQGEGLLVCNEPVLKRAKILSGNIERMGLPHTVVTCTMPDLLAQRWPEAFDAVLADAPCSGEGMFRRDPASRDEWSAERAEGCAARQREILSAAARLVRPGGRLVYATCTYNPAENEENAAWFLRTHPDFSAEAFSLPGADASEGIFTCYPHRLQGEGQFAALFRKAGDGTGFVRTDRSLPAPSAVQLECLQKAFPAFPQATHQFGSVLVSLPGCPDLQGIRTLRVGQHLAEIRGNVVIPDHAIALSVHVPKHPAADLTGTEAVRYLAGETLDSDRTGWTLMRYRGLVLGWGKGSGGMMKNHYPKGLRKERVIP